MKKWLVGLMAAGLCAASAWAAGVATLPVDCSYTSTQDWTALDGFTGKGVGTYGDGRCKFDSSGDALTVQFDAAPGELTFELKGNTAQTGTAPASFTVESSADGANWNPVDDIDDSKITASDYAKFGPYSLDSSARYIRWTYANKYGFNFGLNNVKITSGGPVEFSLALKPDEDFEVVQGKSASITATVKGAQGDVNYSWSVDGRPIDLAGNVYTVDSAEVGGPYEVKCEASDESEADPVSASVKYTVVEAPAVTGDTYTLVERADDFEEGADYLIVAYKAETFTSALKNEMTGKRIAVEEVAIAEDNTVTTDSDSLVWTISAGAEGKYTLYNEAANVYAAAPASESANEAQLLEDGTADAAQWTIDVAEGGLVTIGSVFDGKSLQRNSTAANAYFANYKSGTKPYLFKKAGASGPSVSLSASATEVEVGEPVTITATAKNFSAEPEWSWTGNGTADGATFTVDTSAADVIEVTATATAGEETASKSVTITVSEPAQKYTVSVNDGILNGTIELSVDDGEVVPDPIEVAAGATVKVVATPASGFKLASLEVETEGGQPVELSKSNTFEMPAENVWISASFEVSTGGTATYTVTSKTAVEATGDVPEGSEAVYAADSTQVAQISSNKTAVLTLKGYEGMTITGLTLSMKSNKSAGSGSLSVTCGDAVLASIADSSFATGWSTAFSTEYVDVVPEVTATAIDGDVVITIAGSVNSLYCQSYTVEYETGGSAPLRVSLDQENPLRLDVGTGASVTATATGGEKPYTFAWECSTAPELNGTGETLAIPDTLGLGTYNVWLTVSDSSDPAREIMQAFVVVVQEPAVPHDVKIAVGMQGGVVTAEPEKASVGETVTLTATPADGKKLESMTVTYGETTLTFTSSPAEFEMPDEDVYVGATFVDKPVVSGDVLTRESTGVTGSQYKDWTFTGESGTVYAGQSAGGNESIQLRTTSPAGIVITESAGSDVASVTVEWNDATADKRSIEIYGSADAYTGPADLYGDAKGTLLGTIALGETTLEIPEGYPYVGILAKGGALYLSSVAFEFGGAAAFSVSLDPSEDFEVKQGQDAAITATVRGAQGEVTYSWSVDGTPIDLAGNVYAIDSSAIGGPHEVVCEASDGVSEPVSASVSYTVVEVPPVTGETYVRVESADDFEEGAEYLIVAFSKDKFTSALKNEPSDKRIAVEEVVIADDNTVTTDSDAIVWTISAGAEGKFTLYNAAQGVYAAAPTSESANEARLLEDGTDETAQWTIDIADNALVTIGSLHEGKALQRNSTAANAYFANYKSGTKPFLFKKAGPSAPSISVSGETTKKVGETFSLQFTLKNYEGDFEWSVASREGGSIDGNGLYTWTPSDATDGINISVEAVASGETIATKTVTLVVEEGDVPPPSATLTCEPSSVTMAKGESFVVTLTLTGTEQAVGYIYFEGYEGVYAEENHAEIDLADLELAEGTYTLVALATDSEMNELARTELPVTVTGEGPQPGEQPVITNIHVDAAAGEVTVTFTGDGSALQGTDDLVAGTWEDVSGATIGSGTAKGPMDKPYLRIRQ